MARASERLDKLERENEELKRKVQESCSNPRSNPGQSHTVGAGSGARTERSPLEKKLLRAIDDALTELDEGREEDAYELLNNLLDKHDED